MSLSALDDPILRRFRTMLGDLYGDRLERVVLFGSRAREDSHPESDYDVAVFLTAMTSRWEEAQRLGTLRLHLLDETGAFFDLLPFPFSAYEERSPLMREIRREGRDL